MATEDEIRARVEAADMSRSQARAKAAATIASDIERRMKVRAELAEIDAAIATAVAESAKIMTLAELSEFTGIAERELLPQEEPAGDTKLRRSTRRKAAGPRKTRPVVLPASDAPVAVSSDF